MAKVRADILLVERGLAESRSAAQRLVMAGQVRANGQVVLKPSSILTRDVRLEVDQGQRFVSRGGDKLAAALAAFPVEINDRICADVGASTGGFTDCLLQHGARRVYAIDVGEGILHWKLRQDARVIVMEDMNARYVESLPEPVDIITIDASFISLKVLLPVIKGWFASRPDPTLPGEETFPERSRLPRPLGQVVALIKPQFEAGRSEAARGDGVIRDTQVHQRVLEDVLAFARQEGFGTCGLIRSPLLGPKGNVEFLAWLSWQGKETTEIETMIAGVL